METIYWIQRLGDIGDLCTFFCILIGFAILCISVPTIACFCNTEDYDDSDSDYVMYKKLKSLVIKFTIPFFITMLAGIFIPSEKDLYVIYGIGGTIDYIRSNETANGLPDKAVKALDLWLEEKSKEKN